MFYFVIPLTGRTEQVDWDTVERQLGTHKQLGVASCSQSLAVDMQPGGQPVGLPDGGKPTKI